MSEGSPDQRSHDARGRNDRQAAEAAERRMAASEVYTHKKRGHTDGHDDRQTQSDRLVDRLVRVSETGLLGAGRINAPVEEIRGWVEAVEAAKTDGHNPRTLEKDRLAWTEFERLAQLRGFTPNLCTTWTRRKGLI